MFFKKKVVVNETEIDKIERAQFPIIFAPFHGAPVAVKLRKLTQAQTIACGDMSLIETFQDKVNKKCLEKNVKISDIISYAERNNEITKKALVSPSYDQILERISGHEVKKIKEKIKQLKIDIESMKDGPKKSLAKTEIDSLRVWCDFLLPEDFMATIVSYTLGIDESDINEISEKALINSAVLAERGHNNPADHIKGAFTDFMQDDINKRAWVLLQEQRERIKNGG